MLRRLLATVSAIAAVTGIVTASNAGAEVPVGRTLEAAQTGVGAGCRLVVEQIGRPDVCHLVDGQFIDETRVAAYEKSWTHRALTLQRQLDAKAPLIDELFAHTHNSFNADAYNLPTSLERPGYYPTLTNQDPNQLYTLTDQLRMDVRAIELDLHWFPSPFGNAQTGGNWVTLCHGQTQSVGPQAVQIGCTIDRPVQDGFAEVADWLKANPKEFILLYLENQLQDSQQAHIIVADQLKAHFGKLIVPTAKGKPCEPMPYETSRASLMAKGYRVLIVGNCSVGADTGWGTYVHERGPKWDESGDPSVYSASDCARDTKNNLKRTVFKREYEDLTFLSAVTSVDPTSDRKEMVSRDDAAFMARCGVNLIGFDRLQPGDGRLDGLVWSWAQDEPRAKGCAYQGTDTRWRVGACSSTKPVACQDKSGSWKVPATAVSWNDAARACAALGKGWSFAAPVNGLRNAMLATAKGRLNDVWVATRA